MKKQTKTKTKTTTTTRKKKQSKQSNTNLPKINKHKYFIPVKPILIFCHATKYEEVTNWVKKHHLFQLLIAEAARVQLAETEVGEADQML